MPCRWLLRNKNFFIKLIRLYLKISWCELIQLFFLPLSTKAVFATSKGFFKGIFVLFKEGKASGTFIVGKGKREGAAIGFGGYRFVEEQPWHCPLFCRQNGCIYSLTRDNPRTDQDLTCWVKMYEKISYLTFLVGWDRSYKRILDPEKKWKHLIILPP